MPQILWGLMGSRAHPVRDINTWLTRVQMPSLWPMLVGCEHKQNLFTSVGTQLILKSVKPTQIISLRHSSLIVASWNATKSVILICVLKVKWLQSRQNSIVRHAHCEAELRNRIHPLGVMTLNDIHICHSINYCQSLGPCLFLRHTTPCVRSRIRQGGTHSRCLYRCRNSPPVGRGSRCSQWGCAQGAHKGACFGCCSDQGSSFPLWGPCESPPCRPSHLYPCAQACSPGKWCLPLALVSDPGCLCLSYPRRPPAARGAAARLAETLSACRKVPGTVWCNSHPWRSDASAWNRPQRGSAGGSGTELHPQPHQRWSRGCSQVKRPVLGRWKVISSGPQPCQYLMCHGGTLWCWGPTW